MSFNVEKFIEHPLSIECDGLLRLELRRLCGSPVGQLQPLDVVAYIVDNLGQR